MRAGQKTRFARKLRRSITDAEREIWHHLRNRSLMGCKFRRQHPVGRHVVDFACLERRLVVELDGGQHAGRLPEDAARTKAIETMGFRILRFWNNDVFEQQEAVLAVIHDALQRCAAHPNLPPRAREGDRQAIQAVEERPRQPVLSVDNADAGKP